jgi:hypothetical protein
MKTFLKRALMAVGVLAAFAAIAAGGLILLAVVFEYPGGMSSTYRAADHDRRLTGIAREAAPAIQAIDRFYKAHAQCPREDDLEELRQDLPQNVDVSDRVGRIEFRVSASANGWLYSPGRTDPSSCSLWHKLGWDPALVWLRHGEQTKWVFVPGDGSEGTTIDLDIGG